VEFVKAQETPTIILEGEFNLLTLTDDASRLLEPPDLTEEQKRLRTIELIGNRWRVRRAPSKSAAECTPGGGYTKEDGGFMSAGMGISAIFYDPTFARYTPNKLWLATGIQKGEVLAPQCTAVDAERQKGMA
jgi:hypothetical protein